jgi:hypothetical protein
MQMHFLHPNQDLIDRLVRRAVQKELRRLAEEEASQWARCFGKEARKDQAAQIARIIRVASARAVAAELNANCGANSVCNHPAEFSGLL